MNEQTPITTFGYAPSKLDGTEYELSVNGKSLALPRRFSYREVMPSIYDQGTRPWCVAYATKAIVTYKLNMKFRTCGKDYKINEKQIYDWREDKSVAGMMPKTAMHQLKHVGLYSPVAKMTFFVNRYFLIKDIYSMKYAILFNSPILIGLPVKDSTRDEFWRGFKEEGGHALVATGYDDERQEFEIRNSWGYGYGQNGYWNISYDDMKENLLESWCISVYGR